jgi:A/G-specific adenine glycosylase
VQSALLDWYRASARPLPWRQTRDPYAVLVSELMLQQTQVSRVLPKFLEFLERFPTFDALAAASRAEVIRRWAPLGYNLRAVRLHDVARQVVERGGSLPDEVSTLIGLRGLGRYTAAAVACFAFGRAVPVLDTNVRRVLGRVFLGEPDPRGVPQARLWQLAEQVLPPDDAYDWNQALMDLGAIICTARRPACPVCPLREHCGARPSFEADAGAEQPALLKEHAAPYHVNSRPRAPSPPRVASGEPPRRILRGRLVQLLRDLDPGKTLTLADAARRLRPGLGDPDWLLPIAEGLAADGLIELVTTPVDADAGGSAGWRLRLPLEQATSDKWPERGPGPVESPSFGGR